MPRHLITYVVFQYQFALHPPLKSDREINTQPIIDMNISALKLRPVFISPKDITLLGSSTKDDC